MLRARSKVAVVAIALALVGILAFVGAGCSKDKAGKENTGTGTLAGGKDDGKMVAKVNGKTIGEADVAKETQRLAMQMSAQIDPQQMQSMQAQGVFRKQAIENMISRQLLEQAAAKEDIKVAQTDIDARIGQIKKGFPSEQEFTTRLQDMGMTPADFQREIEAGMRFDALLAKHTPEIKPPTDAEMKSFYDSNPSEFQQPEQIRASHILISVGKDDTPAQKSEKMAKITKIRSDIKGGADFAQMATKYSDCPSKDRGGDLGYFGRGQMVAPFDAAAFALKVGEMSDIVTTDFGYHIIKVTDHKPAHTVTFDEAKSEIANYMGNQQKQAAVGSYIQSLRAAAKIEYGDTTGTGTPTLNMPGGSAPGTTK
ncbi:MAG TPA: peptidylprolyl isomerase [bacterium]|nr:peptidylprolyl isomerase [bacterium]